MLQDEAMTRSDILTTRDCGRCDAYADAEGVPRIALMDRAGRGLADAVIARWSRRPVAVLCGPGNNGGDGYVAARYLERAGWSVTIYAQSDPAKLTGDAAWAHGEWAGAVLPLEGFSPSDYALVIDALFGAGLTRPLEGIAADCVTALARSECVVVSADVPSGVFGDRSARPDVAFAADLYVTFNNLKPAHVLEPAAAACGEVQVVDIGIPPAWTDQIDRLARLNSPEAWWDGFPRREAGTHKHREGRLVVFSGGASSTGAARLAAHAGLRMGAGLVTLASPPSALQVNASALTAVMLACWEAEESLALLAERRASAFVAGPALGLEERAASAVQACLESGLPGVVDADALTLLAERGEDGLQGLGPQHVLTPHAGEFERLFPGLLEACDNEIFATRQAADLAGCTILLKGAATVIAVPGGDCRVNRHAHPRLATAGSGDVLAGMIGALLARGMPGFDAACAAAWLHGDIAQTSPEGLIAEDLVARLPARLDELHRQQARRQALSGLVSRPD